MTRDDGRESEQDASGNEGPDEEAATAETRLMDDPAAELETRVVSDEPDAEESEASPAEPSETVVERADAATVLSGEDDRTQLVGRGSEADALASASTRVLDPSLVPETPTQNELENAGASPPETRVLDDPDKTAPPPVERAQPDRAAEPPAATRAASAAAVDPDRGLAPGSVLFGEYEIVNVLGVGGMGEVYRARHRRLEEHRAIKVMHAELSKKKGASEFFYREAKALLAVRHPAVVHCHDLLSDESGRVYLIMEMIEGIPLSTKMNEGPLSPDDVAILGARVSHGLAAAHRKGVIHRDLSPDNIVLPNGRVQEAKIIDFGIAKLLEDGEGTIVDGFKGKLSYASPEQLGFFGGKIDGRSDFYSLGLVLVAAAQGRPMSMGTTVVEAVDARRSFQTLPDAIPMGLRSAIQPLLALDPDDRPKYVDRLFVVPGSRDGVADTGNVSLRGVERSGGEKPSPGSRTGLIAGAAAAAVLLVSGGAYFAMSGKTTVDSPSSQSQDAGAPSVAGLASGTVGESASTDEGAAGVIVPQQDEPPSVEPKPVVAEVVKREEPLDVVEKPVRPTPRRVSAGDRIKIIGLINNAKLALEENRLMSPRNDNAYDRYRRVLELDPSETRAKDGLRAISVRYVGMAERAAEKGNLDQARLFVDRAKRADATVPRIAIIESRLSN